MKSNLSEAVRLIAISAFTYLSCCVLKTALLAGFFWHFTSGSVSSHSEVDPYFSVGVRILLMTSD